MSLALTPETIDYLLKLPLTPEQLAGLVERLKRDALAFTPATTISGSDEETERLRNENTKAERKRAADRERMAAKREAQRVAKEVARQSPEVARQSCDSSATVADLPADQDATAQATVAATPSDASCAQVVILTSSLRSEGTSEPNGSSVDASTPAEPDKPKTKPPKSQRGTRLDPDWEPSAEEFDLARSEGLTDEEIHRAALEFRNYWCSRSRDATKLSWRLTWHNRVIEVADRKRQRGARLAASPNQPGAGRRGATSFADIFVERHGLAKG